MYDTIQFYILDDVPNFSIPNNHVQIDIYHRIYKHHFLRMVGTIPSYIATLARLRYDPIYGAVLSMTVLPMTRNFFWAAREMKHPSTSQEQDSVKKKTQYIIIFSKIYNILLIW